ncbi:AfsR/SARP family transcriptional regulator [Nonomuraea sp. MG754425]|uniref:BTAD domain-containing putative transcriptional regulator n=1 Tax=Nonomuraea sp. MG754425 TaxID=2570319 RepID=UPI001EFFD633|nr:BTAD domain-containing putative transcriptional regulator [Nonomuraea sp. MG754425]MCF6468385.1 AfsR/SARP family transcriptional regulator [Nonomuraea sp. MG754425]
MRVSVLGPIRVHADDGTPIDVGGARLRGLLARLALSAGQVVQAESLIDALWGEHPPSEAGKALHALVYRLRKVLGSAAVESVATGYRLPAQDVDVDAARFEALAARGRRELAAGRPGPAAECLGEALGLWRGPALADVPKAPFAAPAAARLAELRLTAAEDRFEAGLRLGRQDAMLADLEAASAEHPLRERLAALRMRALHAAGRQSDALKVFDEVRDTLADQLGIDPSPELRAARLAVLRGERTVPPVRAEPPPGRLPAPLTGFVGRDDELALLGALLDTSRLVTVVGPGGAGKTRLALEAASRHRAHGRGRVWLVSLAGADAVAETVLGVLSAPGVRPVGGGPAEPVDRVADLLGGGEALLVLDNCEHLVAAAAEFTGRLLERQPSLTILATSREPLDIIGEAICRLGPLPQPAAVRLFTDRATAVRPGITLDDGPVTDIVRRLDGLPLALELAAARLRTMDADRLARRLDDRFRLLTSGNRTAQPRQQTLHAVIDWSWELLDEQEKTLARRISAFPATTGADAVEAVCSGRTLPPGDVGHVLDSLVDKSIVERAAGGYRMLETIRAYAATKLDLAGERSTTRDRFARHFAGLAEAHERLLRSHGQEEALRLFGDEYDNLVHALRTAIDDHDATTAARILAALHWYWTMVRYEPRSAAFVARVLELGAELAPDARAALGLLHATGADAPSVTLDRVRALIEECARTGALERHPTLLTATLFMAYGTGLDALAERETERARSRPDPWAAACTFLVEAIIGQHRGEWAAAATAVERALHRFEETGDRLSTALVLTLVARTRSVRGDHDGAIAAYERSVALTSQHGITHRLGLAAERMRAGDLAGARQDIESAERSARERGGQPQRLEVMAARMELYRRCGDVDRAGQELERMERAAAESPLPPGVAIRGFAVAARLANLLTAGDAKQARALLPDVVRVPAALRDLAVDAQQLARLLHLEGEAAPAATALGMSRAIRGVFDDGDPELGELAASLTERLGPAEYDAAYRRGARMPRQDVIDRLTR